MMPGRLLYQKTIEWLPMKISDPWAKTAEKVLYSAAHCNLPGLMIARFDNTGVLSVLKIPRRAF